MSNLMLIQVTKLHFKKLIKTFQFGCANVMLSSFLYVLRMFIFFNIYTKNALINGTGLDLALLIQADSETSAIRPSSVKNRAV